MIVHLNGRLLPRDEARISPFDRGFIFGDGVYEGLRTISAEGAERRPSSPLARVVGLDLHIDRMRMGLDAARIATGDWDLASLGRLTLELLDANSLRDAFVYWQVTRGTPSGAEPARQRVPPAHGLSAGVTVFGYCAAQPDLAQILATGPVAKRCALLEDPRWRMGYLKSTSLMGNVVSAIEADRLGCDDAIFVHNGLVSEGLATNVLLLTPRGEWVTPSLDSTSMLAGITRAVLIEAGTRGHGPRIAVRPVLAAELAEAREIVLTGSSTMVASVVSLDGRTVGSGHQTHARELLETLVRELRRGADDHITRSLIQGHAWNGFRPDDSCRGDLHAHAGDRPPSTLDQSRLTIS